MALGLSPGDWIAILGVFATAGGAFFIVRTERHKMRREDLAKAREEGERDGASEHDTLSLQRAMERLGELIERANKQYRDHELECTRRWADHDARQSQIATTLERVSRNLEQTQSQVRFLASDAHDRVVQLKSS